MRSSGDRGFRLSPLQQRLWRLHRAGRPAYAQAEVALEGELDRERLATALERVVERHEALRTSFRPLPGLSLPLQFVGRPGPVAVPEEEDLRPLPAAERDLRVRAVREREAERTRDPAADGPLGLGLLRTGDREWLLVVTLPALLADSATLDRLFHELTAAYAGDASAADDEEPLQLADVGEWQRENEAEEPAPRAARFWARHSRQWSTEEAPAGTSPPEEIPLGTGAGARLEELARRSGASPRAVLLAAWALLLTRWTGSKEVALGVMEPGRELEPLHRLMGPVAEVLPLVVEDDPDAPFDALAARADGLVAEALCHVDGLRREDAEGRRSAAPERVAEWAPAAPERRAGGLRWKLRQRSVVAEPYRLRVRWAAGEEVPVAISFDPGRVDRSRAEAMARGLAELLAHAVDRPEAPAERLPVMADGDRAAALDLLTGPPPPAPAAVHRLFEAQAARTPDAVALVCGSDAVSYGALDARAEALARRLAGAGLGVEDRLGLHVERSLDLPVAILAAWKAGVAFVVLDPDLPRARRESMTEQSGVSAFVTTSGRRSDLPAGPTPVLLLDGPSADPPTGNPPLPEADPERTAYLVFTSGTTGRPKGIVAPHRGVAAYLTDLRTRRSASAEDTILQLAAPTFDASIRDLIGPLLSGARVALLRPEAAGDPEALLAAVRDHRVTGLWGVVPTMLRGWLAAAPAKPGSWAVARLLVSGEVLRTGDCRRARELFGGSLEVVNQYGPTECMLTTTYQPVPFDLSGSDSAPQSVGRPIAGRSVRILDRRLEPVPPGAVGDVWIGGPGLARGYLGDSAATAEAFVPDPTEEAGARMYRTGDLGRVGDEGALEFVGRRDAQVKIRGQRVEPAEVESLLAAHPDVGEAAVTVHDRGAGGPFLVAYAVARPEAELEEDALRRFLAERVSEAAVPAVVVTLDRLPRTASGKLDRRALPEPGLRHGAESEVEPPATPAERSLAELWADLLGLERVGVLDSFFRLGGHSLLAAQMIGRIREEMGVEVSLRRFWDRPTIRELVSEIENVRKSGDQTGEAVPADGPIRRRSRGGRGFEELRSQSSGDAASREEVG